MTDWEKTGEDYYKRWIDDADAGRKVVVKKEGGIWYVSCEALFADVALPDAGTSADAKRHAMRRVITEAGFEIKSLATMLDGVLREFDGELARM